ncbi:MAG TPA: carboxypeptidase regulatory-like domain-containing protein [Pyrinomonadaceae bacterium]|nr:carboxypeptidase regulatory-like domain-containing protein [Pyrinomonadaceae bacterium]
MNSRPRFLACATAVSLIFILLVSAHSQDSDAKPAYLRTGQEITLSGSIAFTGKAPGPRTIDTSSDSVCLDEFPKLSTDWLIVNDGRVANVLVYVTNSSVLDMYSWKAPDSAVELAHRGCRYQPHVLGVQAGQTLSVVNADATHHNTHPTPRVNQEWNQTQPPGAPPITLTFSRSEVPFPVRDNQHPWEKAYIAVFKHPYFSITDANGEFKIEGLPPGQYELVAWHEEMGEKKMQLTVLPGESKSVGFTFNHSDIREGSPLLRR